MNGSYGMKHTKRLFSFALIASMLAFSIPTGSVLAADATDQKDAKAFLQDLGDKAITVLADDGRDIEEREKEVQDMLRQNLELVAMSRFVLGSGWRKASKDEQAEYVETFSEFVVRTYSKRLSAYGGQTFEITGTSAAGKRDAIVFTRIDQDGAPPIQAGWRVKTVRSGDLKIVDVVVEGVSMLQTQRSEFESVTRRSGLNGLMDALRKKLDKLSAFDGTLRNLHFG